MNENMAYRFVVLHFSIAIAFLLTQAPASAQSPDFFAYYTRLAYDDDNNTGKYADIVVNLGQRGQLVFSREYSYQPYWQVSKKKYFFERVLSFVGDGPESRPDKINKCSYVRIVEDKPDRIVIHWRYAPDQKRDSFTHFRETYCGDIGVYYAEYADEYFTIKSDSTVTRQVKTGCYKLDDWNDPANSIEQELKLTSSGISVLKTTPARLLHLPGESVKGSAVIKKSAQQPVLWMRLDEGLKPNNHITTEDIRCTHCKINGMDSYWRSGVSGSCLSFDGYTNNVTVPASGVADLSDGFTIQAWIAPQEYSWNFAGIVDRDRNKKAGYSLGINHIGQIGIYAHVQGYWQGLMTTRKVPLLKWTHVTAVYEKSKGFSIYFNGELVGTKRTSGTFKDAGDLDLYVGMAHEKQFPWAYERKITKEFLSNIVFSGLIDEVKIFDKGLGQSDIYADYLLAKPRETIPLQFWVLPAGPSKLDKFGAFYTKLKCSPEWDGLWRVGKYADIVVGFEDKPCRFVFWRGTNYLPSLVSNPGPSGIWMSDQGPENYNGECFEHMSDKMCRYSHVRLIENTDARVVVHWRNTSVSISYDWMEVNKDGWGLWTDEYWYIYPDAAAVRYQVSRRLKDLPAQTQQNEMLSQPGKRPEDNVPYDSVTLSNLNGDTETWNYALGTTFLNTDPIEGSKNLVYTNIISDYKHFNIGQDGSWWKVYSQWESMRMAYGHSKYNAWNHYPFGLLPSDGTVGTGIDRVTSSCLGTLNGLQHLLDDGRTELYNIYGMTDLPVPELKILNRSWNNPAEMTNITGGTSTGYDKRQRAYPITRKKDTITFSLNASEDNPVLNPCFVIKNWPSNAKARIEIDQKKNTDGSVRQGIVRDTDGTRTKVIWIKQTSDKKTSYKIY
ncbi:MAG: LamG domain-containing protein [Phycisphaerae bacterium]|nr:LamG domain-containing protein [Phycisphaerae bacterium]